jgi:hypothetical protein
MSTLVRLSLVLALTAGSAATLAFAEPAKAEPSKTEPTKAAAPASGERVDLTPRFKQGQTFTITQKTVRKELQTVANMKVETNVESAATYAVTVEGASADGASLRLELTGLKVKATIPAGAYEWDSTNPPDDKDLSNPALMAYKPVLGSVTTITLSADGSIKDVKRDSRLQDPAPGHLMSAVSGFTNPDLMRLRWGTVFSIHDGTEPVAVGSTWDNTDTQNAPPVGKFVYATKNTLKSVDGGVAKIDITGEGKLEELSKDQPSQGTLKKATLSGSAEWSLTDHLFTTHVWNQSVTLEINAGGLTPVRSTDLVITTTRSK